MALEVVYRNQGRLTSAHPAHSTTFFSLEHIFLIHTKVSEVTIQSQQVAEPRLKAKSADIPSPPSSFQTCVRRPGCSDREDPATDLCSGQPPAHTDSIQYPLRHTQPLRPKPSPWREESMGPREHAHLEPASALLTRDFIWGPGAWDPCAVSLSLRPEPAQGAYPSPHPTFSTPPPVGNRAWAWGGTGRAETQAWALPGAAWSRGRKGGPRKMMGRPGTSTETVGIPAHLVLDHNELNPMAEGETADSLNLKGSLLLGQSPL